MRDVVVVEDACGIGDVPEDMQSLWFRECALDLDEVLEVAGCGEGYASQSSMKM